jgi:hypothetical protein
MWEGVDGPITANAPRSVPGALESVSSDGTDPRTVIVTPADDSSVDYVVVRGREPRLGEERVLPEPQARAAVDRAVAELAAGQGGDQLHTLLDYGIQYVLYPRPELGGPADATMVDILDGTPGLGRQSLSDHYGLWRIVEDTGALRTVSEDGLEAEALQVEGSADQLTAEVGEGRTGRRLALAEPADGSWRATLDGTELTEVSTENGTQAWALPVHGGELRVWHTDLVHTAWVVTQGILLLVVVVLAAPGVRTEEERKLIESTPMPHPQRPSRGPLARSGRSTRGSSRRGRAADTGAVEVVAAPDAESAGGPAEEPSEAGGEPDTGPTTTGSIPVVRGKRRGTRGTRRAGARRAKGIVPEASVEGGGGRRVGKRRARPSRERDASKGIDDNEREE